MEYKKVFDHKLVTGMGWNFIKISHTVIKKWFQGWYESVQYTTARWEASEEEANHTLAAVQVCQQLA
jgi:hypothetical protein